MLSRYWWVLVIGFVVGSVVGFLIAAVVTYVMPKQYESIAIAEIKIRQGDIAAPPVQSAKENFAKEMTIMTTRPVLEKAVDSMDFVNKWAVDKESAMQILKERILAKQIDGTDLVRVSARFTNREDARDMVASVVASYSEYRQGMLSEQLQESRTSLRKALREQQDRVEERRRIMAPLAPPAKEETISRRFLGSDLRDMQLQQLKEQIDRLQEYTGEALLVYASSLDIPDNFIRPLYLEYLKLKREIEGIKANGANDDDALMISKTKSLELMRTNLDEGVDGIRTRLQLQLENILGESEAKEEQIESIETQEYIDAKREFDADNDLLNSFKLQLISEEIAAGLPNVTVVIHDEPVIADAPVSPHVTLNLLLGTASGLVFSPILTLPLMWLLGRSKRPA